nr:MAG TPA: hypothetical protein [Caudoviricetes sp.]
MLCLDCPMPQQLCLKQFLLHQHQLHLMLT